MKYTAKYFQLILSDSADIFMHNLKKKVRKQFKRMAKGS